jgi:hypothetical protein
MMLWGGMTATHLIGPYFYGGLVNATPYAEMLGAWLIPQLRNRALTEHVWPWHIGAPAHFALTLCDILNKSLSWPLCSSDLITPDESL